jgi:hypothetical protein
LIDEGLFMKNIPVLLVLILIWVMGGVAQAFYLQPSIEFHYPRYSPYPPVLGPAIDILPSGFVTINVGDETYYYCNGIFYQKIMRDQKYAIVPPPIGAVVFSIPQGYQYMFIDGISYYAYEGVYYKRVLEGYRVIYPPV